MRLLLRTFVVGVFALAIMWNFTPLEAQSDTPDGDDAQCVATLEQALALTSEACSDTGRNQACYGNLTLEAEPQPGINNFTFGDSGDRVAIEDMRSLQLSSMDPATSQWGVAWMQVQANLPDDSSENVTLLLFGEVEISSSTDEAPEEIAGIEVTAAYNLRVRTSPSIYSSMLQEFVEGDTLNAIARMEGLNWVQVKLESGEYGWVFIPLLDANSDELETLPVLETFIQPIEPARFGPMQAFYVETGIDDAPCQTAPDSGLLIQTPEGITEINLRINEVDIHLKSTAYIQAQAGGEMVVTLIEGEGRVSAAGASLTVPSCSLVRIPMDANLRPAGPPSALEACDEEQANTLPTQILIPPVEPSAPLTPSTMATIPALTLENVDEANIGEAVRAHVTFTGDASDCPAEETVPPLDAVLVIDISGSMEGEGLTGAKASAATFIEQLNSERDRVAVVVFSDDASVLTPFTSDFGQAINDISGLSTTGGTAIDTGLRMGYEQFSSRRADSQPTLLLLSDGGSDPSSAQAAASQLKDEGIRLITVGVGGADQPLLSSLASDTEDFLYSPTGGGLSEIFLDTALQLSRRVAARSAVLTFRVDTERYQLVENLLTRGTVIDEGLIQWNFASIADGQSREVEFVVRPTQAGEAPIGSAELVYLACQGSELARVEPITGTSMTVLDVSPAAPSRETVVTQDEGVLTFGVIGTGMMMPLESQRWLLEIPDTTTLSVVVDGLDIDQPPLLIGADDTLMRPLYLLNNMNGENSTLAVFGEVPAGTTWMDMPFMDSSQEPTEYSLEISDEALVAPTPLTFNETFADQQTEDEGRVYSFEGAAGDIFTITYVGQDDSYTSVNVIATEEGRLSYSSSTSYSSHSSDDFLSYGFGDSVDLFKQVIELASDGTYLLLVKATGRYSILLEPEDTRLSSESSIRIGETLTGTSPSQLNYSVYNLDAEVGQTFTVIVTSDEQDYSTIDVYDSDRSALPTTASMQTSGVSAAVVTTELTGPYPIYIQNTEGGFSITVQEGDTLTQAEGEISVGASREGTVAGVRLPSYTLNAAVGQTITVHVNYEDDTYQNINLSIADANNNYLSSQVESDDSGTEAAVFALHGLPPFQLFIEGVSGGYSLRVEDGDTLRQIAGELTIGSTVSGSSSAAGEIIIYTLDIPEEQLYTFRTEGSYLNIEDSVGDYINYIESVYNDGGGSRGYSVVYSLPSGTYSVFVTDTEGSYTLTVTEGDSVRDNRGEIAIGDSISDSGAGEGRRIAYTLEGQEGQVISIELLTSNGYFSLQSPSGRYVDALASTYNNDGSTAQVYSLPLSGTYSLVLDNLVSSYALNLTEGDILRIDRGMMSFGEPVSDSATEANKVIIYTLDATAGDTISLAVADSSGYFSLRDAEGNYIYSVASVYNPETTGSTEVYELDGVPPFRLERDGEPGTYTLTLFEGDVLRTDAGTITLDEIIEATTENDDQILIYTLEAEAGQTLTVSYTGEGFNSYVYLVASDGERVTPVSEGYREATIIQVYEFTEMGTYQLNRQGDAGSFSLLVSEGDGSLIPMPPVVVGGSVTGMLNFGERAVHPITVESGDELLVTITSDYYSNIELTFKDDSGSTLSVSDRVDQDNRSTFTLRPSDAGDYELVVSVEGPYTLTVRGDINTDNAISISITSDSANLRTGPGTNYGTLGSVSFGTELPAIGRDESDQWLLVVTPDRSLAWVFDDLIGFVNDGDDLTTLPVMSAEGAVISQGTTSADEPEPAAPADEAAPEAEPTAVESGATCTVTAISNANLRTQPSANGAAADRLLAGQSTEVDGQTTGADGMVWWHLTTDLWVRSDTVTENACDNMPQMEAP